MNILDLVVGKPIKTGDERAEQIGPAKGIPIFGLDALSSAAYGPEAALSLLIPLGLLGVRYIVPISTAIITLLVIVYFSYRQTIAAYPSGGGSYTVARFNLGAPASLLAAAALLADYILTAAVGISAGVGALISAVPSLLPHTVSLCVSILIVITILNLRGVRDAGLSFALPTYLFVGTLLITIVAGVLRVLLSGGHPTPAAPLPPPPRITEAVSYWLLLKVFASGCTALTGVEAVSNKPLNGGVQAVVEIDKRIVGPKLGSKVFPCDHLPRIREQHDENPERLTAHPQLYSVLSQFARTNVHRIGAERGVAGSGCLHVPTVRDRGPEARGFEPGDSEPC